MLTAGDIRHSGLQDLYSLGSTLSSTPATADHNACYRRLWELAGATSLPHLTPVGRLLAMTATASGHNCTFSLATGNITFDWIASYARTVDWT